MQQNRRNFLGSLTACSAIARAAGPKKTIKAVLFDAFPVFDPRPVFALAEELFPGKGADLAAAWRTRQFEYTWLRTISHKYADFWQVTEDALVFAAKMTNVDLTSDKRSRLMEAYLELSCWPDVPAALRSLRDAGIRLAFLSNMTERMLRAGIRNSKLDGMFERVLSTDLVRVYKPDPFAYQMGVDALRLNRDEILFAAFAGWDAAGAKTFGYSTFWVNRLNQPAEELGEVPDAVGTTLDDLVRYVLK